MTLHYSITQEDLITYQLYTASKSERIKKQRRSTWIWVGALLLVFVFSERERNWDLISIIVFGAIIVLFVLFIHIYQSYYYKRHYTKYVLDTFKNNSGSGSTLVFNETNIEMTDSESSTTVTLASIERIDEIKDHFFLQMKQGGSIVIPKRVNTEKDLNIEFHQLAKSLNIQFNSEPNWKWK